MNVLSSSLRTVNGRKVLSSMELMEYSKTMYVLLAIFVVALAGEAAVAGSDDRAVTVRVSVSSTGAEGNGAADFPSISANGRYVSFRSAADNLVEGDTNCFRDIFVHDRETGQTTRISVSSNGEQANAHSGASAISADGRFIAFSSTATNLVPNDTNGANDVFLYDRETGETTRVSVSSKGEQGNAASHTPAISADGRYIALQSAANNLTDDITNSVWDIFVHDSLTGETTLASVSSSGGQSNGDSQFASISADGRYVAFTSAATTLVPGTPLFTTQVYLHDRETGTTMRVSVSSDGEPALDVCSSGSVSDDGRFVAFSSLATNLSRDDQTASEDVFAHDLQEGETSLASITSAGAQADASSFRAKISGNGRYVTFVSNASNLVPDDMNQARDIFRHDRETGETIRLSVSTDGVEGDANSGFFSGPSITSDGQHVAFESNASNLVPGDTNGVSDIFVRGPQWSASVPGDLNDDGVVNVTDLLLMLGEWGACADRAPGNCPADLNDDCNVNVGDLLLLLANWG